MAVKKANAKEWFTIISPRIFGEREIGKTPTSEPKLLIGRTISISAIELLNDMNKYYLKFNLEITNTEGNKAFTQFVGSQCMQDYVSRMVVRRIKRMDTVQDLVTKDKFKIRVKSITIASRRIKSSIEVKIREFVSQLLKKEVESLTLEEFLQKMVSNEIKNIVLSTGRRIYPIRNFEIHKTEMQSLSKQS